MRSFDPDDQRPLHRFDNVECLDKNMQLLQATMQRDR